MLSALCSDDDVNVRLTLAQRMDLPASILERLREDDNPYVRDCAERTLEIKALETQLSEDHLVVERGDDAKLGELLLKSGWFDDKTLSRMLSLAVSEKRPLGQVIIRETDITHHLVVAALRLQADVRRGKLSLNAAVNALRANKNPINSLGFSLPNPFSPGPLEGHQHLEMLHHTAGEHDDINAEEQDWRMLQTAQCGITRVLSESQSLADAAPKLLQVVCESVGWDVGALWGVDLNKTRLRLIDLWHVPALSIPDFEAMSRQMEFEKGIGLPGRVWETDRSAWITDACLDGSFPRFPSAQKDGLHAGFGFPIHVHGQVIGVLEVFSCQVRQPDDAMLSFFYEAGSQICQFVERKESENQLRQFHAIIASVSRSLVQSATMRELLQGCAQAIVTHLDATFARIWTVDESGKYLLLQASAGLYTHIDGGHQRIAIGQFKVGLIASERTPHLTNDVQSDPRVSNKEWALKEGIVSFAGHPLLIDGKLVGVMAMFARHPLSDNTISALSSIADHVALGIQRKINEQAHEKLASIVDSFNDGIISIDLEGMITQCNNAAERIYGMRCADLIGKPISILDNSNGSAAQWLENVHQLQQGIVPEHHEATLNQKDGTHLTVSLSFSAIKDPSGDLIGAAVTARDITQRKRQESLLATQYQVTDLLSNATTLSEAVQKSLETIAKCLNCTWGAHWLFDAGKQHLYCTNVWSKDGENLGEFSKISRHMTFPVGTGTVGGACLERRIRWEPAFSTNEKHPRAGVAYRSGLHASLAIPVVIENRVLAVMEFFNAAIPQPDTDLLNMVSSISTLLGQYIERKCAEQKTQKAMEAEQQIAQAIIDRAPAAIARLNANLIITSMNDQFAQQLSDRLPSDSQPLLGKFIFQVMPDFPTEKLIDTVEKKVPFFLNDYCTQSNFSQVERRRYWDLAGWPVDTDDGGMILMATEVTDRVKLSEQRDDFVATLTHDLKNPIIGAIRLLNCMIDGKVGNLSADQTSLLGKLVESNQSMLSLICNLLEVYRYDAGLEKFDFAPVDMKVTIDNIIQEVKDANQFADIRLQSFFPQQENTIIGDAIALRRVITNLLSNALKFTADGGTVIASGSSLGGTYVVEISDTGSGISPQEQEQLFKRFSQGRLGRSKESGTGLGLYLSRQIVEKHGGKITCRSEVGVGTTFTVCLPVRQDF
ncbi:MAG TPA: GAF domain-containing protein [Candidatus Obscuribacterales bacterium]